LLETYRKEVSEAAERILHEMKAELTPHAARVRLIADTGDAAESIIQTAEETGADLVVLGQRGLTANPAFLLGGVSQKVATYAPCSVLVVKTPVPSLDRLLLAVDGSDASKKTARFLAGHPFRGRPHLTVVTAWPVQRPNSFGRVTGGRDLSDAARAARTEGEALLKDVAARLQQAYEVETEWLQGDPAFAILEAAARSQAQVIVLGARGLTGIKRFLLGSVSQKVLVHAPCSVLIVR
jgi:nucleotide-binding universal stress UspA family protein